MPKSLPRPIGERRARTGVVNLTVSMSDDLYEQVMKFKRTQKVSISALVRRWMDEDLLKFEVEKRARQGSPV